MGYYVKDQVLDRGDGDGDVVEIDDVASMVEIRDDDD